MPKKLLIADDEALWANLIKGIFEGHNFDVVFTLKGKEVPELAKREKVDLILLDVNFPDTNGFEICERLMHDEYTNSIPVVLLTAQSDPSDLKRGLELGASDYVEKHSTSLELLARVQSILRRRDKFINFYKYEAIIENLPIPIGLFQDNKILFCNKALISTFGYQTRENLSQLAFRELIFEEDIPLIQSIIDQVLESDSIEYFRFKGKRENGEIITLDASLNKVRVTSNIAILFNCRQIT